MEDLFPKCQVLGCGDSATLYIDQFCLYCCDIHKKQKYPDSQSIRLINSNLLEEQIKHFDVIYSSMISFITCHYNMKQIEETKYEIDPISKHYNKIITDYKRAKDNLRYHEFSKIDEEITNLDLSLRSCHVYTDYLISKDRERATNVISNLDSFDLELSFSERINRVINESKRQRRVIHKRYISDIEMHQRNNVELNISLEQKDKLIEKLKKQIKDDKEEYIRKETEKDAKSQVWEAILSEHFAKNNEILLNLQQQIANNVDVSDNLK